MKRVMINLFVVCFLLGVFILCLTGCETNKSTKQPSANNPSMNGSTNPGGGRTEPTEPGKTVVTEKQITITVIHSDGTKKVLTSTTSEKYLSKLLTEEGLVFSGSIVNGEFTVVDGETARQNIGLARWELYAGGTLVSTDVTQVELEKDTSYTLKYVAQNNVFSAEMDLIIMKMAVQCQFVGKKLILTETRTILGEGETKTFEGQYELTEADDGTMQITFQFEDGDNVFGNKTHSFETEEGQIKIGGTILMLTSATTGVSWSTFVPNELTYKDLPASNGAYYYNDPPIEAVLEISPEERIMIRFGYKTNEKNDYLYLNPEVLLLNGDKNNWNGNYQFRFTPSAGYVTTITDVEPGDYRGKMHTTFIRAFDYALPSSYVSEECPGTVWYMSENVNYDADYCVYIDVQMYKGNGTLVATMRLYIGQDATGAYYLIPFSISNLNQLEEDMTGFRSALAQYHVDTLVDVARAFTFTEGLFDTYSYPGSEAGLESADVFVVERRAPGQGFYFDYAISTIHNDFCDGKEYADKEIIAVTIRWDHGMSEPGPLTYYFIVVTDTGSANGTEYELIAYDDPRHMHRIMLYAEDYPGYST